MEGVLGRGGEDVLRRGGEDVLGRGRVYFGGGVEEGRGGEGGENVLGRGGERWVLVVWEGRTEYYKLLLFSHLLIYMTSCCFALQLAKVLKMWFMA